MKEKMIKIMMLLVCIPVFWACETDNDSPVALTPDSFVLNTPVYVSGVYDLKNTETIQLTCSQPAYGFTAATTYRVQIATQNGFTNFATLPTSFTTAKIDASASEMAVALVGLLGVEDEAYFPTDPFPVYVRLSAELSDGSHQVLSNIITLPKVKSYFALDAMVMPDNMYLVGNVAGNWDWTASTSMVPVNGTPGKFWAMQYLGKMDDGSNAEIKFNKAKAWDDTAFGIAGADIDADSKALAGISGTDNIVIGNPGWYIVVVTTEISGRDYIYHVQFLEPDVYLCGNAAGGKWGADGMLFTVPDVSLGADASFVSPAFIGAAAGDSDGGVRACVVIVTDWWRTEFMVFNGTLVYRANGGDQDRIAGSVGQKLSINFTKGTGKIE